MFVTCRVIYRHYGADGGILLNAVRYEALAWRHTGCWIERLLPQLLIARRYAIRHERTIALLPLPRCRRELRLLRRYAVIHSCLLRR